MCRLPAIRNGSYNVLTGYLSVYCVLLRDLFALDRFEFGGNVVIGAPELHSLSNIHYDTHVE